MNYNTGFQYLSYQRSDARYYIILFILWPFLAFISAIANFDKREAKIVVYAFLVYYGLTFVNNNIYVDAYRYALSLKDNAELPFSAFFDIVVGIYATDTTLDIVEPLISFIVSRFTSQHSIYFAVWAALYGFFYLKSINLLYNKYQGKGNWNVYLLMFFFVMVLPITSIMGIRMWTAAWIFFYGAYHVVIYKNPRFLILSFAASLVHWSFISANVILLIYYLLGNRNLLYIPIAIASFVLPGLLSPVFQAISMRLGGAFQHRYEGYSSEGYVLAQQQSMAESSWFIQIGNKMVFYYLILAIIIIELRSLRINKDHQQKNLFSFLLLFLSFVNFGMAIPSLGNRFQLIFFLLATTYLIFYHIKLNTKSINLLVLIGLFPMLLLAGITFRMGSESISAWILTPGFGVPLMAPVLSISDLLF